MVSFGKLFSLGGFENRAGTPKTIESKERS